MLSLLFFIYLVEPPVIDEGLFVPRPPVNTRDNVRVKIGTPVYVYSGFDVIINCNIINGTPPVNITWFRNGSLDPTRGNVSTITITDASNGDVFECRVDNIIGFDTENTTIYVEYGKCVNIYKSVCVFVCVSYNIGKMNMPDINKQAQKVTDLHPKYSIYIHIRQIPSVHVIICMCYVVFKTNYTYCILKRIDDCFKT